MHFLIGLSEFSKTNTDEGKFQCMSRKMFVVLASHFGQIDFLEVQRLCITLS